jgi:hypothetical protein
MLACAAIASSHKWASKSVCEHVVVYNVYIELPVVMELSSCFPEVRLRNLIDQHLELRKTDVATEDLFAFSGIRL